MPNLRRRLLAFLIWFCPGVAFAQPGVGPDAYARFIFDFEDKVDADWSLVVDQLEVFVVLNDLTAPRFLSSVHRRQTAAGWGSSESEVGELRYYSRDDFEKIFAATEGQTQLIAAAIGQPAPLLRRLEFRPGTRLARSGFNTFENTVRELKRGQPARYLNSEFAIAMDVDAFRRPGDTLSVVVSLRRIEWNSSTWHAPIDVTHQVLLGDARRASLGPTERELVGHLLRLHHCQAALN